MSKPKSVCEHIKDCYDEFQALTEQLKAEAKEVRMHGDLWQATVLLHKVIDIQEELRVVYEESLRNDDEIIAYGRFYLPNRKKSI